jgi:flap endonuclease-1
VQNKWKYTKIEPQEICLQATLDDLGIDQFQLVDLSILVGTDYFPGVQNIGPKTALKLVKKHISLENVIAKEKDSYDFSKLSLELINNIRKIFLLPNVIESPINLYWNPPNKSATIEFLCKDHHLNIDRVSNNLDKLSSFFYACMQYYTTLKISKKSIQKTLDYI